MEILIRLVDGRMAMQVTPGADKVTLLGMMEMAKATLLSQPAPAPIQVPSAAMSKQLLNGHG